MNTFEERHRERKRKAEMKIIIENLLSLFGADNGKKILEFGSGEGYQIPYLRTLGDLVASDIYQSEHINKRYRDLNFVVCDIKNTPFETGSFDLIFSNHVLEHIKDIETAFTELKRIGNDECLYAFTVPTSTWLLLSLPAQVYNGIRRIFNREKSDSKSKRVKRSFPAGHGWRKNFLDCFNSFKIKSWHDLFTKNGFKVLKVAPLLLYAPSEFPVVPTTRFLTDKGICSSAIFIIRKG